MKTFSEKDAAGAFSWMSRARFSNPKSGIKPSDVCLFAWLVAEAARVNCNPFSITTREIFYGFDVVADGKQEKVASVGMSWNTTTRSLENLESLGFIKVGKRAATRGHRFNIEIMGE